MRRMMRVVAVAAVLVAASSSGASAQRAFGMGAADIGPVIGLGGIGSAGLSFGGRFEKAIKELPNLGDGVLAIQVSADYYSFSNDANFSFKYIPIGVTANYHIKVNNEKVDPFVGAGLGYLIFSCSSCGSSSGGGIYFVGRAGLRYYLASGLALYGDVGAGAATLNLGVMFRISGKK